MVVQRFAGGLAALLAVALAGSASAAETPKRGGILNYVIPADAPDPTTVVFHLKFATSAFLPAVADPYNWIYKKETLDKDPHWYEKNILGSGPFKLANFEIGQAIKGERNPDYYQKGLPYLDGF